jgi:hypothetical protein
MLFVLLVQFVSAEYVPYVPKHSYDDVINTTRSACSPPGTVSGCATCYDSWDNDYKTDCVYYIMSRPSECSVVYSTRVSKNQCIYFMFHEKIKDKAQIVSTCQLEDDNTDQLLCIWAWAVEYKAPELCKEIPDDTENGKAYRENCYRDYAKQYQDPSTCKNMRFVDGMLDCCTAAKGVAEQYVTTRQDLIDSFTAKYGEQLKACKAELGIKAPQLVGSCEDLNCQCLSPCNGYANDAEKQQKCARDCSIVYAECYAKVFTMMSQEANDRFIQQSFYGLFSRKHCKEYQGLAGKLKTEDHGQVNEPDECTSASQCSKGRVCNACGKCADEDKVILPNKIDITYSIEPDSTEEKIKNTIFETAVFRVQVSSEITADGKVVDYCDLLYPGPKPSPVLKAEFAGKDDLFAGFTDGRITDVREASTSCNVNIRDPEKQCILITSPNERLKPKELVPIVEEKIQLSVVEGKEILATGDDDLSLFLEPSEGPSITFTHGGTQVQQGGKKIIKFKVEDPDSQLVKLHIKVIGPGTLYKPEQTENMDFKQTYMAVDAGEEIELVYKAPEMGNFDIGKAMASLSMVDLQTEAGKQILTDAAFGAVDKGLEKAGEAIKTISGADQAALSGYQKYIKMNKDYRSAEKTSKFVMSAAKAKQFEENANGLINIYKAGKGFANDLPGIYSGATGANKDLSSNFTDSKPTTTEKLANAGVTAINIAQLGVSVLTLVPNKIPGVGLLSTGFQVAFSAATNIWKANLKYIAQAEKIDRAEELFMPSIIVVYAEDMSGWSTASAAVLKVAYQQV